MTDEVDDYYITRIEQNLKKKNIEQADEILVELEEKNPNSPMTIYEEAKMLYIKKDFNDAELRLKQAIQKNKTNPLLWNLLGHLMLAQGKMGDAQQCFEYVDVTMESAKSKFMLGVCNFLSNSNEIALNYFKISYSLDRRVFAKLVLNMQGELFANVSKESWKQLADTLDGLLA